MANNEAKKTMTFWIFSGIAAIVASQLPLLLKKQNKQKDNQTQQMTGNGPREKKALRVLMLAAAILFLAAIVLGAILWLFYLSAR